MALSWSEQILPAGSQTVPVEIAYLDRAYIHLYVNGAEQTDFTWDSNTLIRFGTQLDEPSTITIVRRTDRSTLYIMFAEGAAFIKENLDTQNTQFLHLAQELVEGRAIEGFYGDISMNGYKITNLGAGTEPGDAVNLGQLNAVEAKVDSVLGTVIVDTVAYPWYTITEAETSTITPPYTFNNAAVYINGVCQTPAYSYSITDSVITLADPVPAGTHIFCRLGEDVPNEQGYATAASLAAAVTGLEASVPDVAAAAVGPVIAAALVPVNSTIATKLDAATGNAASATKLATARAFRTDLASSSVASFDGTADAYPGVTGTLTIANGGTGGTTATGARTALGAAASGSNADITALTGLSGGITGRTTGTLPAATKVGGQIVNTPTAVTLVTATNNNTASITLSAGDWEVSGNIVYTLTSVVQATALTNWQAAVSTTTLAFPTETYLAWKPLMPALNATTTTMSAAVPVRRITVTTDTPVYLVAVAAFTGGTVTATSQLRALRVS